MKSVLLLRIKTNRLLAVSLATLMFCLLVGVQMPLVYQQGAMSIVQQVAIWSRFCLTSLVGLVFLFVGGLVWLYASDRRVALVLFGFCSVMMLTFAALSGGLIGSGWLLWLNNTISNVGAILAVPLLALFLLLFPRTYFSSDLRSGLCLLLRGYLACLYIACLLLTLQTLLQPVFPAQFAPFGVALGLISDFYYPVGIICCLVTIVVSYRCSSTPRERQQMRLLVGGVALALLPVLLLTVLPTMLNLPAQEIVDGRISGLSLGLLPLAVGYAILRYQILIFDRYIRRAVAGIVGSVGLALFGFFMITLDNILLSEHFTFAPICAVALTILVAPYIWIRAKVFSDRIFFSEVLRFRHLIEKPATLMNEMLNLNEAASLLTTVAIDTFGTPQVCFFVADKERKSYRICPPLSEDDPNDARVALVQYLSRFEEPSIKIENGTVLHHRMVEYLGNASRPLLLYEAMGVTGEKSPGLSRFLKDAQPLVGADVLLAPVRTQGQLIGVLVLGPRGEQQAYAGPDFDIVQLLLARYSSLVEMARVMLELRAAYEHQKELDRLKDEFIITASHELRTPLTAVQGYIELLSDFGQELPTETRDAFLRTARSSVDELTLMVGNITNVSQVDMDTKQIAVRQVPLLEQVVQTVEIFKGAAQREGRYLHVDIPASVDVLADDFRLRQVMRNLIGNALKYSPPETDVEISCGRTGEQVAVRIRDHGLGIPPEDHARLFNRFARLERDLNSPVRGTGLGLYISKQLLESMGGHIWIESKGIPGQGSTFAFALPSARCHLERNESELATVAGSDQ